jgi:hypothetical protein
MENRKARLRLSHLQSDVRAAEAKEMGEDGRFGTRRWIASRVSYGVLGRWGVGASGASGRGEWSERGEG